jgi:hypothetical protein
VFCPDDEKTLPPGSQNDKNGKDRADARYSRLRKGNPQAYPQLAIARYLATPVRNQYPVSDSAKTPTYCVQMNQ